MEQGLQAKSEFVRPGGLRQSCNERWSTCHSVGLARRSIAARIARSRTAQTSGAERESIYSEESWSGDVVFVDGVRGAPRATAAGTAITTIAAIATVATVANLVIAPVIAHSAGSTNAPGSAGRTIPTRTSISTLDGGVAYGESS